MVASLSLQYPHSPQASRPSASERCRDPAAAPRASQRETAAAAGAEACCGCGSRSGALAFGLVCCALRTQRRQRRWRRRAPGLRVRGTRMLRGTLWFPPPPPSPALQPLIFSLCLRIAAHCIITVPAKQVSVCELLRIENNAQAFDFRWSSSRHKAQIHMF